MPSNLAYPGCRSNGGNYGSQAATPAAENGGLFAERQWQSIASSLRLSGRESQILRLIFEDATEAVIARRLAISPHTAYLS